MAPLNPGLTADPQAAVLLGSSSHTRDFIRSSERPLRGVGHEVILDIDRRQRDMGRRNLLVQCRQQLVEIGQTRAPPSTEFRLQVLSGPVCGGMNSSPAGTNSLV